MRNEDWELFFNGLMKVFIFRNKAYEQYTSAGINPSHWPDCAAKNIALEFKSLSSTRGSAVAKSLLAKRVDALVSSEISHDLQEVIGKYERLKTIAHATKMASDLIRSPEDLYLIVDGFKKNRVSSVETFDVIETIKSAIETQEKKIAEKNSVVALDDFPIISELIGGFNPGRIFIITAETGVGKTTLALNLTLSAINKFNCLYFNMEMMPEDFSVRLMQIGAKISTKDWRSGEYIKKADSILRWIDSLISSKRIIPTVGKALTLDQLCLEIFSQKEDSGLDFVVVDYDQKIRTTDRGEEWQILQRSIEELEEVAKACKIPIIILAQGDEDGKPRASKRTTQSATALLRFFKDDGKYFIELLKNRFGPNKVKVLMDFNLETLEIKEIRQMQDFEEKPDARNNIGRKNPDQGIKKTLWP